MAERNRSAATNRDVKFDLKELYYIEMAERKRSSSKYDLKALYDIEMGLISNPKTGRSMKIGTRTYNNLIRDGYIHDRQHNVLLLRHGGALGIMDSDIPDDGVEPIKPPCGGTLENLSIMDSDVPDIGVEPLKPTLKCI